MDPIIMFKTLLGDCVRPYLKRNNYKASGLNFITHKENNIGIINLQKSPHSSSDQVIFTINIGISSTRLSEFYGYQNKRVSIWECHWRERIGFLLQEQKDLWWNIDNKTNLKELCLDIQDMLSHHAIPTIDKYISDNKLKDLWISGIAPGLTDIERLMNLTILLKDIGPPEAFDHEIKMLELLSRNKPVAATVDFHIRELLKGGPNQEPKGHLGSGSEITD